MDNRGEGREGGLNKKPMTIHVRDNMNVSWEGHAPPRDLEQIRCMESIQDINKDYGKCIVREAFQESSSGLL